MDFIDQEVLVGTTSQDLFTEIMDRTPILKGYFEAFKNERCNRPHPSCAESGCDIGRPNAKTYCFMKFFSNMMRGNPHDVEPFLAIVESIPAGPSHAHNVATAFVASKQVVQEAPAPPVPGESHLSSIRRILGQS